jgi:hypothetical protein
MPTIVKHAIRLAFQLRINDPHGADSSHDIRRVRHPSPSPARTESVVVSEGHLFTDTGASRGKMTERQKWTFS